MKDSGGIWLFKKDYYFGRVHWPRFDGRARKSDVSIMAIARDVFSEYGLSLEQADLDIPEIQSLDVAEVARASTEFASSNLNGIIIKSDVGYYFEALQGFPGPLIKWINQTLSASDLMALMHGKTNRRVVLRECLACRMETGDVHLFEHSYTA